MEKKEASYTIGGNVNWYSHFGEWYGVSPKKLKIELPYHSAIPLLGIYLKKTIIQRYLHPNFQSNIIYNSQDMWNLKQKYKELTSKAEIDPQT